MGKSIQFVTKNILFLFLFYSGIPCMISSSDDEIRIELNEHSINTPNKSIQFQQFEELNKHCEEKNFTQFIECLDTIPNDSSNLSFLEAQERQIIEKIKEGKQPGCCKKIKKERIERKSWNTVFFGANLIASIALVPYVTKGLTNIFTGSGDYSDLILLFPSIITASNTGHFLRELCRKKQFTHFLEAIQEKQLQIYRSDNRFE